MRTQWPLMTRLLGERLRIANALLDSALIAIEQLSCPLEITLPQDFCNISLLNAPEALAEWAEENRLYVMKELLAVFGPLPTTTPEARLAPYHSDLWLLAGLISIADWIGSNEVWFSPEHGLRPDAAHLQARDALRQIGWPGGKLHKTGFSTAFAAEPEPAFQANPLQKVVADASNAPGVLIIEGPMGCGKTEAALFAAQELIASGQQQGIYFALPTQVTSNRIHKGIERFLGNTLADHASLRHRDHLVEW